MYFTYVTFMHISKTSRLSPCWIRNFLNLTPCWGKPRELAHNRKPQLIPLFTDRGISFQDTLTFTGASVHVIVNLYQKSGMPVSELLSISPIIFFITVPGMCSDTYHNNSLIQWLYQRCWIGWRKNNFYIWVHRLRDLRMSMGIIKRGKPWPSTLWLQE